MSYTRNMNPWVDGQILRAEHVNHIEAAIEDLYDNFNEDTYTMNLVEKGKMIDNYIELPGGTTGAGDAYWKQGNISSGGDWDEGQSPYFVISQNYYDATRIENIIVSQYQGIDYADQYVASSTNWLYVYGYSGLPYNEEQAISYYLGKSGPIDAYGQDTAISLSSLFNTVPKYIRFSINKKIATNISATQRTLVADLTTDLETKINNLETYLTGELSSLDTSLNSSLASSVTQLTSQITSLNSELTSFENATEQNEVKMQEEYNNPIAAQNTLFSSFNSTAAESYSFVPIQEFSPEYNILEGYYNIKITNNVLSFEGGTVLSTYYIFRVPYTGFTIKTKTNKIFVIDNILNSFESSCNIITQIKNDSTAVGITQSFNYNRGTIIIIRVPSIDKFYDGENYGLYVYNYNYFEIPRLNLNTYQNSINNYMAFKEDADRFSDIATYELLEHAYLNHGTNSKIFDLITNSSDAKYSYNIRCFKVTEPKIMVRLVNYKKYAREACSPNSPNLFVADNEIGSYYEASGSNSTTPAIFTAYYGEWVYVNYHTNYEPIIQTDSVSSKFQLPNLELTQEQNKFLQEANYSNNKFTLPNLELTSAQDQFSQEAEYTNNNTFTLPKLTLLSSQNQFMQEAQYNDSIFTLPNLQLTSAQDTFTSNMEKPSGILSTNGNNKMTVVEVPGYYISVSNNAINLIEEESIAFFASTPGQPNATSWYLKIPYFPFTFNLNAVASGSDANKGLRAAALFSTEPKVGSSGYRKYLYYRLVLNSTNCEFGSFNSTVTINEEDGFKYIGISILRDNVEGHYDFYERFLSDYTTNFYLPNLQLTEDQIDFTLNQAKDTNNYYRIRQQILPSKTNYYIDIYFPNGNQYVKYVLLKTPTGDRSDTWQLGTIYGVDDLEDTNLIELTGATEFEMAMKLIDAVPNKKADIKEFLISDWIDYDFNSALSASFPNEFTPNKELATGSALNFSFSSADELAEYIYSQLTESRLPYDYTGGYNHGDELSEEGAFQLFIDGNWINNINSISDFADNELHTFKVIEAYDVSTGYVSSDKESFEEVFPINSQERLEKYLNLLYKINSSGARSGPTKFYHYYGWYEYYLYKQAYYNEHGEYPTEEDIRQHFQYLKHKKSWRFENSCVKIKQSVKFLQTKNISGGLLCMFGGRRNIFPYKRRYSNHGDTNHNPIDFIPEIEDNSNFLGNNKLPTIYGNEINYLYYGPYATARIKCKYDNTSTENESDSNITKFNTSSPNGMDKIYYTYYTSSRGTEVPANTVLNSECEFEVHYNKNV